MLPVKVPTWPPTFFSEKWAWPGSRNPHFWTLNAIASKWLKIRTLNLACKKSLGGDTHSNESLLDHCCYCNARNGCHTSQEIQIITLSTLLSQLTSALFLATTSRHVLYALPTPICCRLLESTQPLLPAVSVLLPPQYGTHSPLTFAVLFFTTYFLSSSWELKPTVSTRPSVPPSGSLKCLRFGLWSTVCTIKYFIYLLYILHVQLTVK